MKIGDIDDVLMGVAEDIEFLQVLGLEDNFQVENIRLDKKEDTWRVWEGDCLCSDTLDEKEALCNFLTVVVRALVHERV